MILDCLSVAKKINLKIIELDCLKESLEALAIEKVTSAYKYEESLAKAMLRLKNDHPTTILEKIARGECAELKLAMDLAESRYKNALKIIDLTESQLNGFQSINRYLSEI